MMCDHRSSRDSSFFSAVAVLVKNHGGRGRILTRTISGDDHCRWRQVPFSTVIYTAVSDTTRSVPWCWLANCFREFRNIFYDRNSICKVLRGIHGNRESFCQSFLVRSQNLLGYGLPTFHVVFKESNIKHMKLGDKLQ